jgi:DNA-binding beta-propeller fold protein YncE
MCRQMEEVWAANAQGGTISIVDIAGKKVIQTLPGNVMGANRLKFTPDGKLVFVSTLSGPDLVLLDAATRAEVKRVKIGSGAAGIEMQPDGSRVTGRIEAGKQPDGLAWAVRR